MPSSLIQRVQRTLRTQQLVSRGAHVLLAVSGGADSMAMLDVFCALAPAWKFRLTVAHVHHGLRGRDADEDLILVRRICALKGVRCMAKRVSVPAVRTRRGGSVEEVARDLRYAALERLRRSAGADVIATAHHADDQAETVVLRAARGADVRGLAGILPRRKDIPVIRPMLELRRREIEAYVAKQRIEYRNDASNADVRFRRNALRHRDLGAIGKVLGIEPGVQLPRLARATRVLSERLLKGLGTQGSNGRSGNNPVSFLTNRSLRPSHPSTRSVMLAEWLRQNGVEPTAGRIAGLRRLLEAQTGRKLVLAGVGASIYKERDGLSLSKSARWAGTLPLRPGVPCTTPFGIVAATGFRRRPASVKGGHGWTWVDAERLTKPLRVRSWRPSDRLTPLGMAGSKKVSDILTDARVPAFARSSYPVIVSGRSVVWVCGLRLDDGVKITPATRRVMQFTFHSSVLGYA